MKKKKKKNQMEVKEKKIITPPAIETTIIEMESGIAANSAAVSPVTAGGNASGSD